MRALRSTSLVRRVTPCGWRSRRRRRRFQSEKVENGLRHRRASARVRRFERLRRSREPCPTSEAIVSRQKSALRSRHRTRSTRAHRAIPRFYWPRRTSSSERRERGPNFSGLTLLKLCNSEVGSARGEWATHVAVLFLRQTRAKLRLLAIFLF